jgi:hypothetical protein
MKFKSSSGPEVVSESCGLAISKMFYHRGESWSPRLFILDRRDLL